MKCCIAATATGAGDDDRDGSDEGGDHVTAGNNTGDDWKKRLPNRTVQRHDAEAERLQQPPAADEPFRGSWLDVIALIIATYQVLAVPFLVLLAGVGLAIALFFLIFG